MHDKNPIAPIHKSLYGITKDPIMMHSLITKVNCENLYIYKDKVIASELITKHYTYFGPFDVFSLHVRKK